MNNEELDDALNLIHALVVDGQIEGAEPRIQALRALRPEPPEAAYLEGLARLKQGTPRKAVDPLRHAVDLDPGYADAYHLLAEAHEQLGDREAQIRYNLRTWELDQLGDAALCPEDVRFEIAQLEGQAEYLLSELPAPIRARLENVPVIFEPRPSRQMVSEGFDPRALGLFEGPNDAQVRGLDPPASPSRIVIFYANLLAEPGDDARLAEELRITLLHEIGHYFGLDEPEIAALGLA